MDMGVLGDSGRGGGLTERFWGVFDGVGGIYFGEAAGPGLKPIWWVAFFRRLEPPANPVGRATAKAEEEADSRRE